MDLMNLAGMTQICTKNKDQIMYDSWDMVDDGQTVGKKWHFEVGDHLLVISECT